MSFDAVVRVRLVTVVTLAIIVLIIVFVATIFILGRRYRHNSLWTRVLLLHPSIIFHLGDNNLIIAGRDVLHHHCSLVLVLFLLILHHHPDYDVTIGSYPTAHFHPLPMTPDRQLDEIVRVDVALEVLPDVAARKVLDIHLGEVAWEGTAVDAGDVTRRVALLPQLEDVAVEPVLIFGLLLLLLMPLLFLRQPPRLGLEPHVAILAHNHDLCLPGGRDRLGRDAGLVAHVEAFTLGGRRGRLERCVRGRALAALGQREEELPGKYMARHIGSDLGVPVGLYSGYLVSRVVPVRLSLRCRVETSSGRLLKGRPSQLGLKLAQMSYPDDR